MALYRINLFREVKVVESVTVDIDLPCPPHPTEAEVIAAIKKLKPLEDLDWCEDADSRSSDRAQVDSIDGIADDDDTIVETNFD